MKAILNNRVIQHIVFWCFYVLLYMGNYVQNEDYSTELLLTCIYLPPHLLFTYSQLYFLIPQFLLKKKILLYTLFTILVTKMLVNINMLAYAYIIYPVRNKVPHPGMDWSIMWTVTPYQFKPLFALFMICGVAVSIKLLKKWFYEKERNNQIEKEKLNMELEMLKAQVHPHFLFNTLNNLYSLTLSYSDKAPVVVTHLSDLLRYMLYECNQKEVLLEKEIALLKKYVELEKLRYGNRIDVSFACSGNIGVLMIAPLLLLPFVENSFKHGTSEQLNQCWINIHLHADGDQMQFNMSNSYHKEALSAMAGGIGLRNIKKRLELIYEGKYELNIIEEADMFVVKLEMQLNKLNPTVVPAEHGFIKVKPAKVI